MQLRTYTEQDFDQLSWHDNLIYGFHIDRDELQWECDLVFDIDFLTEWLCPADQPCEFMIAPATLRFHNATDLKINVDCGDSGFQASLYELSIEGIERERVVDQKICLDRPYYRWSMNVYLPYGRGTISFGASGFTQIFRDQPILCKDQRIPSKQRSRLFGAT